jgi:hypothetical protein
MKTVVRTKTIFDARYREPFLLVLSQGTVLLPVTQLARANTLTVRTAKVVLATAGSLVTPVRTLNTEQSRQSAVLLLQSSELGPPIPSPASECVPSPFGSGGYTLACGIRDGGSKFGRGTDTVVLYRCISTWSRLNCYIVIKYVNTNLLGK